VEVVEGGDHSLASRGRSSDQLYEWLAMVITRWTSSITEGPRPQGSGPGAQH
jgi:hypothetical protein